MRADARVKRAGQARSMLVYSSPFYDALQVARSRITGRGLFAGTVIPARAKIGEFEGEVIPIAEARRRAAGKRIVAIIELEGRAIDASVTRRGFRYINHSCEPNTFTRLTRERAEFSRLAPDPCGRGTNGGLWRESPRRQAALPVWREALSRLDLERLQAAVGGVAAKGCHRQFRRPCELPDQHLVGAAYRNFFSGLQYHRHLA